MTFMGIQANRRQDRAFFSMKWHQPTEEEEEEACGLLGEETVENGKTWWICGEKSASMDCQPVAAGWGNPDSNDKEWLCKQPKPGSRRGWRGQPI